MENNRSERQLQLDNVLDNDDAQLGTSGVAVGEADALSNPAAYGGYCIRVGLNILVLL